MKDKLVGKLFTGNPENRSEIALKGTASEKDLEMMKETQKILESIELLQKMEAIDSGKALKKVKIKVGFNKSRKWMLILQRTAAILVLPLLSFAIWQAIQISNFNQSIVQNVITTPPTLRSIFTLPDGSKVWLNGNTTITYPTFFKGKERLVELNGEAYFQVAHNKQKPFIVKSGKMLVEAVGTEFNCLSFTGDKKQETLLTEGKVKILEENESGRILLGSLNPNQMAVFDGENNCFNIHTVNPEKYTAWKDGQIIFKNDVLSDVLNRLERWYNVEFVIDQKLKKDYAFTGSFEGEELTQILNYIELTTPITFKILKTQKDANEMYQKTRIIIKNK
jgi:ferric-dicitrate binding protein FerR (iron transport regulator)